MNQQQWRTGANSSNVVSSAVGDWWRQRQREAAGSGGLVEAIAARVSNSRRLVETAATWVSSSRRFVEVVAAMHEPVVPTI